MYKKLFILLIIFFNLVIIKAQKSTIFTEYYSSYAGRNYNIKLIYDDTNNYKLEIDLMTFDNRYLNGGLIYTNKTLPGFIQSLDTAIVYYNNWVVNAKIRKGSKRIIKYFHKEKVEGYFYSNNKTRIDFPLNVKYRYRVLHHNDEIVYVLNISTGNLRSQHGQQYTVQSFSLFFISDKEIEEFQNLITPEKVKGFIKANN